MKTFGKTTGTMPCYITPEGKQGHIYRIGKANIIEQVRMARRAVESGAEAFVVECMAVLPANQRMAERQMIHSTVGVITNIRADHLDEMGPTMADVARSLAQTIPTKGVAVTADRDFTPILRSVAGERGTELVIVSGDSVTDAQMKGFAYLEHKENVAIALEVCRRLGVSGDAAMRGMQHVVPDPGVMRIFSVEQSGRRCEFVNAFAANDPDSYVIIWKMLQPHMTLGKRVIVIVNCRKDRIQRSESLAELIVRNIGAEHYLLVGELTAPLEHRAIALGMPPSKITNLGEASAEEVFERVMAVAAGDSLVVGIGNIVGFGEEVVTYFTNRGTEYAY